MEYESRKIKWYYLLLFVLFCVGVVYLLFSGNPYLYSHLELRSALVAGEVKYRRTIPSKPDAPAKLGPPSAWARYNLQRTAVDPVSAPRSRSYVEFEKHAVELVAFKFLDDVLHDRLFADRQHFFGLRFRGGQHPRSQSRDGHNGIMKTK